MTTSRPTGTDDAGPGDRWKRALLGGLLVSVAVVGVVAAGLAGREYVTAGSLLAVLETVGPFAPLLFVALQTLQVIVAPVPGQILAGVGGYLFGPLVGTGYSMLGVVLGSIVVFVLTRRSSSGMGARTGRSRCSFSSCCRPFPTTHSVPSPVSGRSGFGPSSFSWSPAGRRRFLRLPMPGHQFTPEPSVSSASSLARWVSSHSSYISGVTGYGTNSAATGPRVRPGERSPADDSPARAERLPANRPVLLRGEGSAVRENGDHGITVCGDAGAPTGTAGHAGDSTPVKDRYSN